MKPIRKNLSMRKLAMPLFILLVVVGMTSCSGANKAQQLSEGTWVAEASKTVADSDDLTGAVVYLSFSYDKGLAPMEGTFDESYVISVYSSEEGIQLSGSITTLVKGTYRVEEDRLYLHYDLSTSEVNTDDLKVTATEMDTMFAIGLIGDSLMDYMKDLAASGVRNMLSERYGGFNSEDEFYSDLEIDGDTMTLTAEDLGGKLLFQREF